MTGWATFAAVFVLFFVTHSVPVRPPMRQHLVRRLGPRGFTYGYSALSIGMLVLLIWSAGNAPFVTIWHDAEWHRTVTVVGMFFVCLLLASSIGRPNPFSFGGRHNDRFDPADAGIISFMRHPLLNAMAIWAALHVLANGDLAHVLLFGTLGAFAVFGQRIVDMRKKRELGPDRWASLWEQTRRPRALRIPSGGTLVRLGGGVVGYAALVHLHPVVIGRPVFL